MKHEEGMMQHKRLTVLAGLGTIILPIGLALAGDSSGKSAGDDMKMAYEAAKRGYWQEAMARYEHASKMAPGDGEIWSNLAVSLEAVGRYEEAGEAYRKALDAEPGNSKIQWNYSLYREFFSTHIERHEADESKASPPGDGAAKEEKHDLETKGGDNAS